MAPRRPAEELPAPTAAPQQASLLRRPVDPLRRLRDRVEELEGQLAAAREVVAAAEACRAAAAERDTALAEARGVQREAGAAAEVAAAATEMRNTACAQLAALHGEVQTLGQRLDAESAQAAAARGERDAARSQLAALQGEVQALSAEAAALRQEHDRLLSKAADASSAAQQVQALSAEAAGGKALRAQLRALQGARGGPATDAEALRAERDEAAAAAAAAQRRAAELCAALELERERPDSEPLVQQVAALMNERGALREELAALRRSHLADTAATADAGSARPGTAGRLRAEKRPEPLRASETLAEALQPFQLRAAAAEARAAEMASDLEREQKQAAEAAMKAATEAGRREAALQADAEQLRGTLAAAEARLGSAAELAALRSERDAAAAAAAAAEARAAELGAALERELFRAPADGGDDMAVEAEAEAAALREEVSALEARLAAAERRGRERAAAAERQAAHLRTELEAALRAAAAAAAARRSPTRPTAAAGREDVEELTGSLPSNGHHADGEGAYMGDARWQALRSLGSAAGWLVAPEEVALGRTLGQGAFGVTRMGSWRGGDVAVKAVRIGAPSEATSFLREVAALAALRHPNILGFYGACLQPPEHCWLLCEYLAGGSLSAWLHGARAQGGRAAPRRALVDKVRMALGVAQGMQALEAAQPPILHRDLKPSNVLLDAAGVPRVADMGLARRLTPANAASLTGETGTYVYMAPEMIRHEAYDQTADVYSWGVLLAEVLMQRPPYEGLYLTPVQAALAVGDDQLRPTLPPDTPAALVTLAAACFEPLPEHRPSFALISHHMRKVLAEMEGQAAAAGQGQENSFWGVGGLFGKARPAAAQLAAAAAQFGTVKN
ncbi:hypothetical protein WJX81_006548 [Elliptochloris bilobata]|uniref:Protein kinase domain-containing protein n=1 Tax=Elliptochloris bilobata TaxID=381761 RepID=A0AAW1RHI6_9CHLO